MVNGKYHIEVGLQQETYHDADEQGRVDFLRDQCQNNCDNRRQQGPGGAEEFALDLFAFCAGDRHQDTGQGKDDQQNSSEALHSW